VEKLRGGFDGALVAHKVVGKAIALLCIYAKVRAVYALTISRAAKRLLEENDIYLEWDAIVERILSGDRSTTCPFERLVEKTADPAEAYRKLKIECYSTYRSKPV
jgi:hypothetical protein